MPWPSYSERFLEHSAAGSWDYYVPAQMRAVVKFLSVVSMQTAISVAQVSINGIACYHRQFPAGGGSVQADLMAVAYQGDLIRLYLSHSDMLGHLSGYVFQDLTGHTGPPRAAAPLPSPPPDPVWHPFPRPE